uniref:Sulfhydryl oxidase n=1 Tax=Poecilia formosa TaxID=48698 RepID=A0A087XWJ1_POEFO
VSDWHEAIAVAVLDCAQEENFEVCKEFRIWDFNTGRFFVAHSSAADKGTIYRGADREVRSVRQLMVNILQNHSRTERPQSCPPLEPYNAAQLLPLLGQRSDHYTAIIVEEAGSFVGREVILDLLQFSGVEVRRALASDLPLLDVLNMAAFPSVYLLHPNGSHAPLHSEKPLRFFFSSLLRSLPGVQRRSSSEVAQTGALQDGGTSEPWRDFDRSQVYTADLESALHYLLRVELAAHGTLEGAELKVFKDFVTLVAKLYPVGGSVVKLMETLSDWLLGLPVELVLLGLIMHIYKNTGREISGVFLGAELRWVGCQGSRLGLRGYPCSLWTLFHVLTVQHDAAPAALDGSGLEGEAAPVLQVMRRYIRTFFGCKECGRHFEQAAAASMDQVTSREDEVLWLWNQHNRVNTRLAGGPGSLSDDPVSPKAPWPSPALCPACHEESNGVHVWNHANVLAFLRRHYGASNLNPRYSLTSPRLPAGAGPAQTRRPQEERPAAGGERRKGEDQVELRPIQPGPRRGEQAVLIQGEGGFWILGLGFTSVDMSLCVVLYGSSCLFLMLLFFFFKVRSRRCKLRHARLHV